LFCAAADRQAGTAFELHRHGIGGDVAANSDQALIQHGAVFIGVPLTHRQYSQGVVFITGHGKTATHNPDWATLAKLDLTLVIYMASCAAPRSRRRCWQAANAPTRRWQWCSRPLAPDKRS
jgi:siroheme synthase